MADDYAELVKRLDGWDRCTASRKIELAVEEAARAIEALVKENARLRAALRSCPPTSNPTVSARWHLDRIDAWWRNEARPALEVTDD